MTTETNLMKESTSPVVREHGPRRENVVGVDATKLANGLGWFSIGLGLTELIAPRAIARLTGTRNNRALIRSYGLREIGAGIGILMRPGQAAPVWSRVAGDALDLAALGKALIPGNKNNEPGKTVAAIAGVAGITVLDVMCAQALSRSDQPSKETKRAEASAIVNRSPEECYRFWRDFENLPRFMSYLQTVRITGDTRSHWVAKAPGDRRVAWDAELELDVPGERITWHSLPGSEVYNSGSVEFTRAAGGRGTIVRVQLDYAHPAQAASTLAKLAGKDPEQMIHKDLRRFKQVMETGEVITTEGQSSGRTNGSTWLDSVAR